MDRILCNASVSLPLLLATFLGATFARAAIAQAEETPPNFVIINIDDLGYGDVEPFGAVHVETPHLSRMAAEGRKLTSFYAAPVCSPSRASLMTGCYPKRALPIPHVLFPANDIGLAPEEITVAELLKDRGYVTAIVGKWHLGDQPEFLPTRQGFDSYFGLPYSNDMGPAADGVKSNLGAPLPRPNPNRQGQPPLPLLRNETVLQRVVPEDQQMLVKRYTDESTRFLRERAADGSPFFLYLPHSAVHFPLYPSEAFRGKSDHGLFGDWVQEVDWSVGEILRTLRDTGLAEKTLVLFTSDNGGATRHGSVNDPLRASKGATYEGGIRVPTIAWWPGTIPAGTESDAITSMMDILPTFVRLAGGAVPRDRKIDGVDIWPTLAGDSRTAAPRETFYYFRGLNLQAVRHGRWKLHLKDAPELYDLETDIGETRNLASAEPELVEKLQELAHAMASDLGTEGMGPGCRPLGKVDDARPLINHDGTIRDGFAPKAADQ